MGDEGLAKQPCSRSGFSAHLNVHYIGWLLPPPQPCSYAPFLKRFTILPIRVPPLPIHLPMQHGSKLFNRSETWQKRNVWLSSWTSSPIFWKLIQLSQGNCKI